ncbi:MAG: DUF4339 domain-containing protein [Desulfamplus sp.]|nr:DUF4339 domain-containing protein [Desulfamplus sp.]
MLFKRRSQTKDAWKITIPEKYGLEPHIINTSPVVLGCSMQCDIVINDPSVCESHIQFVLIKKGKYLELYDLAESNSGTGGQNNRTFIDGEPLLGKKRLAAQKDKNFSLRAGEVNLSLIYGPVTESSRVRHKYLVRDKDIDWFYLHEGLEYGPVKLYEMVKAIKAGALLPLDDVWHSGLQNRIKAFEIPDLFAEKNLMPTLSETVDSEKHVCPYCWHGFKTEDLLYIARHPALMGDPVLGYDEQQRFVPRHVKPLRRAVDDRGEICTDMACPRCHLRIPTPFLDSMPLFFSIIGTPGSGKSYYLATSTWRLRTILPKYFGLTFEDIDNVTNQWINSYEEKLFLPARGVNHSAIEKTQIESGHTAKQVKINAVSMFLPLPAIFSIISNSRYHRPQGVHNTLSFYDNAGEHFQTGQDVIQKPGSLHMLRANGYLVLFDPTADPRFTRVINTSLQEKIAQTVYPQQKILIETIDRLRKHTGLNVKDKFNKPIVVGISKADLLMDYFIKEGLNLSSLPYRFLKKQTGIGQRKGLENSANTNGFNNNNLASDGEESGGIREIGVLDMSHIKNVSACIRELFCRLTPEFVNTIESFAENVIYLPVSAIGHQPEDRGVHPGDINPLWVEVPFLYILSKMGYIPYITTK